MIDTLRTISRKLRPLHQVAILIILFAFSGAVYSILFVEPGQDDDYLIPSLVGLIWSVSVYSLINLFPNVPPSPSAGMGFFRRTKVRCKRFFYALMGLIFIATSVGAVYIGVRLLILWFT